MGSSSSAAVIYNKKYDVFISFKGSDIRQGFLSHLHKALLENNIDAFVDEKLERGKEISESLLGKIEESHIALVIFSQNYAYSEWCLQELLKIAKCELQIEVIPVFYGVDPSHVQHLTGIYGDAMAQHKTQFDGSLVESWGYVLKKTASLSGLVSSNFINESNLIEEIIKQVLDKLNCLYPSDSSCDGGLVGIDCRVHKLMSLLCNTEDVRVIGIWGEGGIGKTTLAKAMFDRIRSQFDSHCFVRNVREKSEKFTIDAIQNEVVSKLFGTSNSDMTRKRLSRKKVILVLDDVNDLGQLKSVLRFKADFGFGSKIIVTSRDRHLLKILGAKIYEVEKLDDNESLQLFCLNAFNKKDPDEGYLGLSMKAVKYAQGLPLALEVLGSNLFERSAEEWEDELEKLKGTSDHKIYKILRISYDGLSEVEKEIFQDIACCFKGRKRDEVESFLDVAGSRIGISRLAEKALISIRCGNRINMHDLIQQTAKDIICEEKTLEKRRWLWDPQDIYFLLTREMGTEAVRGISLNMSLIKNINLSPTTFQRLYNLRYLHFYASSTNEQVCVPRGLEYLPEQLRYLHWYGYPNKSLPLTCFWTEKLVELDMFESQLEQLWSGVPNLPNLKKIDLSWSTKLIKVPGLSKAANLELLILNNCTSLVEIPDNVCNLTCLWQLDVFDCKNIRRLPHNFGNLESLKYLRADGSGIKEVPPSINNLRELREISFYGCKGLKLPPLTGDFPHLCEIDLTNCGISEFPMGVCSLTSLNNLYLSGNNFESVPESIQHFRNLPCLDLHDCKQLKYSPQLTPLEAENSKFE